jgi:hypothetical protein
MQHLTHSLFQRPGQVDDSNNFLDPDYLSSYGFDSSMTCVNGGPFHNELQIGPGSRNHLNNDVLPFFGNNVSFFHYLLLLSFWLRTSRTQHTIMVKLCQITLGFLRLNDRNMKHRSGLKAP